MMLCYTDYGIIVKGTGGEPGVHCRFYRERSMVISRQDMRMEQREKVRDGAGILSFIHCVAGKGTVQRNTNMLAEIVLPPGASIGNHSHTGETEFYVILEGNGLVNDNGAEVKISAGDVMVTGNGAVHSVANTGQIPLRILAAIIKD
jgi:mannose-6-phosphate isomerase-like protein (cupin superfamily)